MGRAKVIPAKDVLFLPYQSRWIMDDSIYKLCEKSRQTGFSWATAYDIDREQSLEGYAIDCWISSRDELQAKLFIDDCKSFANPLNLAAEDFGRQVLSDTGSTGYVLRFANGSYVYSLSSNPDAQAGKRGRRVLDEFALHKDPRKLYAIAQPGITWGGGMSIISTHRGSGNFFNQLIREIREKGNPKKISLHTVTLELALSEGLLYKLQSKLPPNDPRQDMDEADYFNYQRDSCADEESFLQEYCCIPADDASAFLEYDLIASCEMRPEEYTNSIPNDVSLYVGVDIGRKKDLTAIWVNEYSAGRHYTRQLIELKNRRFSEQEDVLYGILALPNMRRCCIDATGLGMQFVERAQERFGKYRVEGITFTPQAKSELAYPVRAAFEDGNVRIPFDKNIRADLRSIRKETTAAGNIRFSADRSENGHADRFWALALAIHAVGKNDGPSILDPAGRDRSADVSDGYHRPDNSDDY